MHYLLYTAATSATGRSLLEKLKELKVDIEGGTKGSDKKINTLIRWGAVKTIGTPSKVLNNAKAIVNASNKLEALRILHNAKIRVPKIFTDVNSITADDFPVLGREIHHIGGNDIVLCLQKKDLLIAKHSGCSYFTQYIPTSVEYRFHIFDELSIKASQKVLTEPERNKDPWIRNFDEGYIYHVPTSKLPKEARELAKQSVKVLGLNFGAVDVIIGDNGKPYVLEVNTAPGLQADSSIEAYTNRFKVALNS